MQKTTEEWLEQSTSTVRKGLGELVLGTGKRQKKALGNGEEEGLDEGDTSSGRECPHKRFSLARLTDDSQSHLARPHPRPNPTLPTLECKNTRANFSSRAPVQQGGAGVGARRATERRAPR